MSTEKIFLEGKIMELFLRDASIEDVQKDGISSWLLAILFDSIIHFLNTILIDLTDLRLMENIGA